MSNPNQNEDETMFQRAFDQGFEFGQSEALEKVIGEPVSPIEMAHALHIGGVLAGLAIKLAEKFGEDNALYALQQAQRAVAIHCEHKRMVKKGN